MGVLATSYLALKIKIKEKLQAPSTKRQAASVRQYVTLTQDVGVRQFGD
jgi:hypothetical protein